MENRPVGTPIPLPPSLPSFPGLFQAKRPEEQMRAGGLLFGLLFLFVLVLNPIFVLVLSLSISTGVEC